MAPRFVRVDGKLVNAKHQRAKPKPPPLLCLAVGCTNELDGDELAYCPECKMPKPAPRDALDELKRRHLGDPSSVGLKGFYPGPSITFQQSNETVQSNNVANVSNHYYSDLIATKEEGEYG